MKNYSSDSSSAFMGFVWLMIIMCIIINPDWWTRARYAVWFNTSYFNVSVDAPPKTCDFWSAPVGTKSCHLVKRINSSQEENSPQVSIWWAVEEEK